MSATLAWHYSLLALPLNGQVVWIRRDAWADRPRLATFVAAPASFTMEILAPGGLHITDLTVPASQVICWKFTSLADQDEWIAAAPP